jgi:hypothetical protein
MYYKINFYVPCYIYPAVMVTWFTQYSCTVIMSKEDIADLVHSAGLFSGRGHMVNFRQ